MVALSYVLVTVLAWRLLGEPLPRLRLLGLGVILLGVTLMALSYRDARSRVAKPPPTVQGELPDAGR
jgi:drug/metabolite transporter (DMT)-like permease